MNAKTAPTLPREIAPGTFWLSGCAKIVVDDEVLHSHSSFYLVAGEQSTILIDTGYSRDWAQSWKQLEKALDGRTLDYIFPTHPEMPHMGNIEPLLEKFPEAKIVGDLRNYHLYLPKHVDRFEKKSIGDHIDLGGTRFLFVEALLHDLPNTLWGYQEKDGILFACDAYCFTHEHHQAGECAMTAEELAYDVDISHTRWVLERGLAFTRHVDPEVYCDAFDAFFEKLNVNMIAPTHGGVITDPAEMTRVFKASLRSVRAA